MEPRKYQPRAIERGKLLFGEEFAQRTLDEFHEWDEQFGQLFETFVYGGMYDRSVIDQKTRELCAVAACVCMGAPAMIKSHGTAALRMGATPKEVMEVILQMSVYAGFPRALTAARNFRQLIAEQEKQGDLQPYGFRA